MRRSPSIIFLFFIFGVRHTVAQDPARSTEDYIENIFVSRIGEAPRMGWFAPTHGFVTSDNVPELVLYASVGMPQAGRRKALVERSEVNRIQKRYGELCEAESQQLVEFDVGGETDPGRALYTTKKLPGDTYSGILTVPLDPAVMNNVNRVLAWPSHGVLRRDEALAARAQSSYYSFHKLYNAKTGKLREEAIVLHGRNGQILAHELLRDQDKGPPCDGCGIPSYDYPGSGTYRPLNMFELPGFVYPLVLLNTSTFEGEALSLLTFTPDGIAAQFRAYEYVIHCH